MKLKLSLEMPQRESDTDLPECEHCNQKHDQYARCEGFGYDHFQEPAYETEQVEDSSYLKKALAQFKKKRAKKNAKD